MADDDEAPAEDEAPDAGPEAPPPSEEGPEGIKPAEHVGPTPLA